MQELTKYAFANAKIRAMLSYLIDEDFFSRLWEATDIYELRDALKETAYKDVMEKITSGTIDLATLEKELLRRDLNIHRKVSFFLNTKNEKELIFLLIQRFELEELKVILRIWNKKIPVDKLEDYLLAQRINYDIDFKKLILCQNIEEVILLLDETPYKKPLIKAREKFKERNSIFYLEAGLDIDYYQRLLGAVEKLSSLDRQVARKILGIEIDIENINWLLRLRKYHSLGIGEILDWVIPGGERIDKDNIRSLYATNGLAKVIEGVALGPYAHIKNLMEQNVYLIENFLYDVLHSQIRKVLAGFPFTIGTILGYLILEHKETRNIISLFYAKGLSIKKEDLSPLFNF